jgi:hypothetical protein
MAGHGFRVVKRIRAVRELTEAVDDFVKEANSFQSQARCTSACDEDLLDGTSISVFGEAFYKLKGNTSPVCNGFYG